MINSIEIAALTLIAVTASLVMAKNDRAELSVFHFATSRIEALQWSARAKEFLHYFWGNAPKVAEQKPLSAPAIFAVSFAFALVGLVGYGYVIMHPEAQQLLSWAQTPI